MTLAFLSLCASFAFAEDSLTAYTGADFSRGKFGHDTPTETWSVPFSAKYETGPFSLKSSISYLQITGPANVVGSGEDFIDIGQANGTRSVSGWGDLVVGGAWTAYEGSDSGWLAELVAKIKFGTADEQKGLGTGKNDYSLQGDLYKSLGPGTLFLTLGTRKMGDPDGVDLRDPLFTTIGWSQRLNSSMSAGLMHDFRQAVVAGRDPAREATAFVAYKLNETWKVQGYAVHGFSDASPDFGLGLIVSARY
jgi:hypothetical protein